MSNEQEPPKRLLTVADVADWLSISGSLVYQLVESGKLPIYRIGNGRGAIRFRPEDIESYLFGCRTEKVPARTNTAVRPRLKHIHIS